jgi:hypothetical protein
VREDVPVAVSLHAKLAGFGELVRPQRLSEGRKCDKAEAQIGPPQVDVAASQLKESLRG